MESFYHCITSNPLMYHLNDYLEHIFIGWLELHLLQNSLQEVAQFLVRAQA